jgi:hypothetical protein
VRRIIRQAGPEIVEEWRWVKPTNPGVPVWSHNGGICTGETYKSVVEFTFYKGASLSDLAGLFNSSLALATNGLPCTGTHIPIFGEAGAKVATTLAVCSIGRWRARARLCVSEEADQRYGAVTHLPLRLLGSPGRAPLGAEATHPVSAEVSAP